MPKSYSCLECCQESTSKYPWTKFCSVECRNAYQTKRYGRFAVSKIPTGTVGAIAELEAAAFLMKKGYSVFRALSPACFCDLIAIKDGKTFTVEVRTGYRSVYGALTFPKRLTGEVDLYAVYVQKDNEVNIVPAA